MPVPAAPAAPEPAAPAEAAPPPPLVSPFDPDLLSSVADLIATGEVWVDDSPPVAATVVDQFGAAPMAALLDLPAPVEPAARTAAQAPAAPGVEGPPAAPPAHLRALDEPSGAAPFLRRSQVPRQAPPAGSARTSLQAALAQLLPAQTEVHATSTPRVQLGFRDGTSTTLEPGSSQSLALEHLAQSLTRRD
ncbi:MAG: hypothetical protein JWM62_427 [Frankiales bacterium]|jgi:hypothetical protein|nr:hypothetical protein [Frankiales bacterium]